MKKILLTLMYTLSVLFVKAQTMTGTVLTQPCNNNGSIGVTVIGLTPPINYSYKSFPTVNNPIIHNNVSSLSDIATGLSAYELIYPNSNTWTVTATNGTNTAVCVVTLTPAFTNSIIATNAPCPAIGTLQATNFTGGIAPYSCLWINIMSTQTYTSNPALVNNGWYTLVVTDGVGCKVTSPIDSLGNSIHVNVYSPIMLTFTGTPANCTNGTASVTASNGTAPYTYLWDNGATTPSIGGLSQGNYNCLVTDANGCSVSSANLGGAPGGWDVPQAITIPITLTFTPANCTNGTASVTASNGTVPYSYLWTNGATSSSIGNLIAGQYGCSVIDAIGCQSSYSIITIPQSINLMYNTSITNCTCIQNNGSVLSFISGGSAPYSFLWDNGASTQNISNLTAGIYFTQITDANGCIGSGTAYVGITTPISVTYTASPSSCTAPTGSATLTVTGGLAPYTIVWNTYPTNTLGASISNKSSGSYAFTVTDANGCVQTGSAHIPPVSTIYGNVYNSFVVCPINNGNIQSFVSGLNTPFTYLWSNGATTASLTNVPLGSYSCVITDAVGCSVIKYASVTQVSPVNIGFNITPTSCIYTNDGAINTVVTNGTAPYSYSWSNGQTGANATNLLTGNYYVSVTDANGCHNDYNNSQAFVSYNAANNSCYCTITGTVYTDANNNCTQDVGENGIQNIQIHASGIGYTYTDANGVYSFMAPTGSYTITESVQQIYPLAACQSNDQTVSVTAATNCSTTVNFANNILPIHDLHIITTSINQPIPGNAYNQKIIVQNEGTITENNIQFGYTNDGQLVYNTCTPWALTQQNSGAYPNWYSINAGFPSINAGSSSASYINYNVPTNIPLNTVVNFYDSVAHAAPIATTWLTDNTPWNNVDNHQVTVIGSFDPNFKEVTPKGTGAQGNITVNDSVLTYVVHFQNTGSYLAQNIVVIDSLDSDLNIASLRPGYSDHQYTTSVSENGVIKFTFKNINLAWQSGYGDILSSGMFTYAVKLKKNAALDTQIKNKAAIYFDYNAPIITNTTLNTIALPASVNEMKVMNADDVNLYPNPASTDISLFVTSAEKIEGLLSITDISGREVFVKAIALQTGENTLHQNTSPLQNGIYFVQLKTTNAVVTKKLVIAK